MMRKLLLTTGDGGLMLYPRTALRKRSPRGGFTLVEILVVIAVIGLLVALAIPQFMTYRSEAVDAQMKSDLRNASIAIEAYFAKQTVLPASTAEITGYGFQPTTGVTISYVVLSPTSYRLTAAKGGGTQPSFTFDSTTGSIQ
jgi:prepilin-type N-terminal cleavage/methylation domain-containing protein